MQLAEPLVNVPPGPLPASWWTPIEAVVRELPRARPLVLIRGEAGTGKEWLARFIHAASNRSGGQFVKINCAAPPHGLALELFGHERGARPEASRRRLGGLEFAHNGTLFLDELGELAPCLQPAIGRVIRYGEFTRLGGRDSVPVDLQVIAATRQPLSRSWAPYRLWDTSQSLKLVDIELPPLRNRAEEIPDLANALLADFNGRYGHSVELSAEWHALLSWYPWPGNVRELAAIVRRLACGEDPSQIRSELQRGVHLATRSIAQSA
jgi:transcriptional regulator with GAF, ATPase, and Fis domain